MGDNFHKRGALFYTNKLGRLYENLNKTQMIRHRILGDLLRGRPCVRFDALNFDISF